MSVTESAPATGGQGAATETNSAAVATETGTSPPPAPPPAYHTTFESPEDRGYAENKGWKSSGDLLQSYRNLEKLRGVPAERLAQLPEDWENQDQVKAFLEKLPASYRAPAESKDYGFTAIEGMDPARASVLEGLALKHNVPTGIAQSLMKELAEIDRAAAQADDAKFKEEIAVERGRLEAEVGTAKWDGFLEECRRTARRFGMDEEAIGSLEQNVGYYKTMKFLNAIGKAMGEADLVTGGEKQQFGLTPEAARSQRAVLMADPEFTRRYTAGGAPEREKIERLNQIIALGGKAA